jgi:hypothetical protein
MRQKVKADWDAWNARSLAAEPIVRRILDGTVVRVRLDRKATSIASARSATIRPWGPPAVLPAASLKRFRSAARTTPRNTTSSSCATASGDKWLAYRLDPAIFGG